METSGFFEESYLSFLIIEQMMYNRRLLSKDFSIFKILIRNMFEWTFGSLTRLLILDQGMLGLSWKIPNLKNS